MSRRPAVVAAVGASAGGLEACLSFFSKFPARQDVAFVVVVHLDPAKASQMAQLLGKSTWMEVVQLSQEQAVEPGHVYGIAPGTSLSIRDGVLIPGQPLSRAARSWLRRRWRGFCSPIWSTGRGGTQNLPKKTASRPVSRPSWRSCFPARDDRTSGPTGGMLGR
ncbi:MAG: hypothetical protein HY319_26075 [Armatimonadetes bacterium]|nr:hypothetical protein [Armatimonadota bacterium]